MRIFSILCAIIASISLAWGDVASAKEHGADLVLVAGATGRTGRHVVSELLAKGHSVRVLSRSEASARDAFGDSVQVVEGDVRDPKSLVPAVNGVRFIVSAIGSSGRTDPENSPEAVDYHGVRNMVEAAKAAGTVEHFVLVSSMGITQVTHPLNRFANNILLWKALGENTLRFSGLNYTIVRPGGLVDAPGGEAGIQVGQGDTLPQGPIPRADVARVCVAALGNEAANRVTLEITGDPDSDSVDWEGFFAALEEDSQERISF